LVNNPNDGLFLFNRIIKLREPFTIANFIIIAFRLCDSIIVNHHTVLSATRFFIFFDGNRGLQIIETKEFWNMPCIYFAFGI